MIDKYKKIISKCHIISTMIVLMVIVPLSLFYKECALIAIGYTMAHIIFMGVYLLKWVFSLEI